MDKEVTNNEENEVAKNNKVVKTKMKAEDLSITELKALAYDTIAHGERCQRELAAINNLIAAKTKEAENGHSQTTGNIGSTKTKTPGKSGNLGKKK